MLEKFQLENINNKWLRRLLLVLLITFVAFIVPIMFMITLCIFLFESVRKDFPYYWDEFVFHVKDLLVTLKAGIKDYWK